MDLAGLLKNIDLYLLDQVLKGRINKSSKILDAGCGTGRNSRFFIENGYLISGFDPNEESVQELQQEYPEVANRYEVSDIENYGAKTSYDFVICNAVLHFAHSHIQFRLMMDKLSSFLGLKGILFIRMTSEFAVPKPYKMDEDGRSELPDGTEKYLLTKGELTEAMSRNGLHLIEPLKTINVSNERSMSTIVLTKDEDVKLDLGWLAPE